MPVSLKDVQDALADLLAPEQVTDARVSGDKIIVTVAAPGANISQTSTYLAGTTGEDGDYMRRFEQRRKAVVGDVVEPLGPSSDAGARGM